MLTALLLIGTAFWGWVVYEVVKDDEESEDIDQDLIGGSGTDELTGGEGNDLLQGKGGDDLLQGLEGIDQILGDAGNDIGLGGPGDDVLRGAEGDDLLVGEDGDDRVYADKGDDWAEGVDGDDEVEGGEGDDAVIGGEGEDTVIGGNGDDLVFGGEFLERSLTADELVALREALQAGDGVDFPDDAQPNVVDDNAADTLDGGRDDDVLFVGDGDKATGGTGTDTFYLLDGDGVDAATITDFEAGEESLIYVYDEGAEAPEISFADNGDGTQTMSADGEEVAVLHAAETLTQDDVILYERGSEPGGFI